MEKQYIIILILFLELIGSCLFLLWHYEKEQLLYIKETIFNPSKSKSGLPSSPHMIQTVKEIIKKLPKNNYTLIDIGCGNGDFINKIHTNVSKVIGIELDAKHAELARKRFSNNMSISILTIDMVDYKFDSLTSPTIIYMYEPLWCLKKTDALPIYHKLLKNISEINLKECLDHDRHPHTYTHTYNEILYFWRNHHLSRHLTPTIKSPFIIMLFSCKRKRSREHPRVECSPT